MSARLAHGVAAGVVSDAPTAPVLEIGAARARASEIRGEDQHADRQPGRDHHADPIEGKPPRERLADRPGGADEQEPHDRRLAARHATAARCTKEACCAHSPHCASSSFVTHSLFTAKRSSSRSVVWSISGPSVLKLKRTLCFLNVAM